MTKYFLEADEIEMDVEINAPAEDETVEAKPEEAAPTPVDVAKADPGSVNIACVKCDDEVKKDEGSDCTDPVKCEFYVDAADVERLADLNEWTMIDALNAIIEAHENEGLRADNMIIVMDESTSKYARNLEKHGAAYTIIREADENIAIDVQVGPNGEELDVECEPDAANPLDVVKGDYNNVVVAKQDDKFFMDVEDVQKCADINNESVIKSLNGIIKVNEGSGISADNIVLCMSENVREDVVDSLIEAGASFF